MLKKSLSVFLLLILGACTSSIRDQTQIPEILAEPKTQRYNNSINFLTDAIRANPAVSSNYFKRAQLYYELSNFNQALEDIDEAIDLDPNTPKYLFEKAKVLKELNQISQAESYANQAFNLDYQTPEVYFLLGEIAIYNKNFSKAEVYLANSLKETPFEGDGYYFKGLLEAAKKDTLRALGFVAKSIELKPTSLKARLKLCELQMAVGNFDAAAQNLSLAKGFFGNRIEIFRIEASLYERQSLLGKAQSIYNMILKSFPRDIYALQKQVYIAQKWKSYHNAIHYLNKLIEIDPKNEKYFTQMGYCYEMIRGYFKAEEFYSKALEINPANKIALQRIATVKYLIDSEVGIKSAVPTTPTLKPEFDVIEEDTRRLDSSGISSIKPKNKISIKTDTSKFKIR